MKSLNFCRILTVILSLVIISSFMAASAQSIPKPSVPEFTAKLADHSYIVPPVSPATPTYTTDPYSGKQVIQKQGNPGSPSYFVKNITIDLTIVNQPYPSMINGNTSFVFFNVRLKGHFGQDWTELFPYFSDSPVQSNTQYTVISLPANYRVDDQIDFQVQAAIGYKITTAIGHPPNPGVYTYSTDFQHASSDWSPTLTFTMPATSALSSPTPTVPELPSAVILSILVVSATLSVIFRYRRKTELTKHKFLDCQIKVGDSS